MSIFLKASGITGSATQQNYNGAVPIERLYFLGVSVPVSNRVGQGMNKCADMPSFGEIALVKLADDSSNKWFQYAHDGTVIPSVEIDFLTTGNPGEKYQQYKLSDVHVTHYSETQGTSDHRGQEYITLAYNQIEKTWIGRDAAGNSQSPNTTGYNLADAKSL